MAIVTEATFENGVLRPDEALPLKDRQRVRITVEAEKSWAERTYGMVRWTGDAKTLERIAMDPEFGILEAE